MNINKKTGILLLLVTFIAGGIGMMAHQSSAKQKVAAIPVQAPIEETRANELEAATETKATPSSTSQAVHTGNDIDESGDYDAVDDSDEGDESEENDEDDAPIVGSASLSEARAIEIAESAYTGNGSRTDVELEMEGGVLVYAVEFTEQDGNEVDVKLNAKTGVVILIESDKTETGEDDD